MATRPRKTDDAVLQSAPTGEAPAPRLSGRAKRERKPRPAEPAARNDSDANGQTAASETQPVPPPERKPRRKAPPLPTPPVPALTAPPAEAPKAEAERDRVHTVDARLLELSELPSLHAARPREQPTRVVDGRMPPPFAAAAAPVAEATASEFVDRGAPIPDNYGLDRIVALMRDPSWVFVYWELKGGALERLRFQHSAEIIDNSRWVLRVRTLNAMKQCLVDVDIRAGQWYLHTAPGTALTVDLGFVNHQGDFVEVLKGNEVHTARAGLSTVTDERWMIAREELNALVKTAGIPIPMGEIGAKAEHKAPRERGEPAPRLTRASVSPLAPIGEPRALVLFSSYLAQHARPPENSEPRA